MKHLFPILLTLVFCGLTQAQSPSSKFLDMTYPYSKDTIYWPTAKEFELNSVSYGPTAGGWFYSANDYGASEHGGTHVDAPIHFAKGGRTVDQIPLEEWIGPAVKVDLSARCEKNRDAMLTVQDLLDWEKAHGPIPKGAWVLMYSGIGTKFYPDKIQVLGTKERGPGAIPKLHFPGFSPEAARFLVEKRQITGIGLDTPSIDRGQSQDFQVHQIICGANKLAIENLAHLDRLPTKGALLYAMPIPFRGGSGAPARVFAVLPEGGSKGPVRKP